MASVNKREVYRQTPVCVLDINTAINVSEIGECGRGLWIYSY